MFFILLEEKVRYFLSQQLLMSLRNSPYSAVRTQLVSVRLLVWCSSTFLFHWHMHFNTSCTKDATAFSFKRLVCFLCVHAYVYMYLHLVPWNWVTSIYESTDMGAETWIPVPMMSQHMFLTKEPSPKHPDSVVIALSAWWKLNMHVYKEMKYSSS